MYLISYRRKVRRLNEKECVIWHLSLWDLVSNRKITSECCNRTKPDLLFFNWNVSIIAHNIYIGAISMKHCLNSLNKKNLTATSPSGDKLVFFFSSFNYSKNNVTFCYDFNKNTIKKWNIAFESGQLNRILTSYVLMWALIVSIIMLSVGNGSAFHLMPFYFPLSQLKQHMLLLCTHHAWWRRRR